MVRITSSGRATTRRLFGSAALAAALSLPAPTVLALSYACSSPNTPHSFTNNSSPGTPSGAIQPFSVPASQVTIDAAGGQGGAGSEGGGKGAEVAATFSIAYGQTLCVVVGAQGGSASNGAGGGGGGSFVYAIDSGTCGSNLASVGDGSSAPYLLIAAGGGGGSGRETPGFESNAPTGTTPTGASHGGTGDQSGAMGGSNGSGGGAIVNSGGGGGLFTDGAPANSVPGGQALTHGADGGSFPSFANGGYGGGGAAATPGGGGGGYNGGGAGGVGSLIGGGGGGGSFIAATGALLMPYTQSGVQAGNGAVNFCYNATAAPVPALSRTAQSMLLGGLLFCGLFLLRRRWS